MGGHVRQGNTQRKKHHRRTCPAYRVSLHQSICRDCSLMWLSNEASMCVCVCRRALWRLYCSFRSKKLSKVVFFFVLVLHPVSPTLVVARSQGVYAVCVSSIKQPQKTPSKATERKRKKSRHQKKGDSSQNLSIQEKQKK